MLILRRMLISLGLRLPLQALSIVNFVDGGQNTFPVPGGPKSNIPRAGSRRPENKSGRRNG
jgi:hypothetical protein